MHYRVFLPLADVTTPSSPSRWGYDPDDGPNTWQGICMTGSRQSPINIDTNQVDVDITMPKINFVNYEQDAQLAFDNNGHTGILPKKL